MVWWSRAETCFREIRILFPAPAVISDLVVVCHSSSPIHGEKYRRSTVCRQREANFDGNGYRNNIWE